MSASAMDFTCVVCHKIASSPHEHDGAGCAHITCASHIGKHCQKCGPGARRISHPSTLLECMISKYFDQTCLNGCGFVARNDKSAFAAHRLECKIYTCPNGSEALGMCDYSVLDDKEAATLHINKLCAHLVTKCSHCNESHQRRIQCPKMFYHIRAVKNKTSSKRQDLTRRLGSDLDAANDQVRLLRLDVKKYQRISDDQAAVIGVAMQGTADKKRKRAHEGVVVDLST